MKSLIRFTAAGLLSVCLVVVVVSCDDDSRGGGGGEVNNDGPAPDAVVVQSSTATAAFTNVREAEGKSNAAVNVAEVAQLDAVDISPTGARSLTETVVGQEIQLELDIDDDGEAESIYGFVATVDGAVFVAWTDESFCHLSWNDGTSWFMSGACGGTTAITCSLDDAQCWECDNGACDSCRLDGSDVFCDEPSNNGDPDTGVDTGECATSADCSSGQECNSGFCVPVETGLCDQSCMSQSGAVCCTTCGCEGDVQCQPTCGSGYQWDCEIGCCFNYDTFECSCGSGELWDGERYCCAVDGVCVDQ